ncbi:uncharacterized protein LOC123507425 isoform X2 [Portunus trituberculatus]|nr:uncharacterized protein LOC123507425 isoform X2 [Portunus trituberculatus]
MEQQQLTTPTVLIHEPLEEQLAQLEEQPAPVEEQPISVEEPALPPAIQPEDLGRSEESDQPSQIELGSVEEQERRIPHARVRHARPLMDAVCVLSKDAMKNQMKDYSDIMRTLTATEDVAVPGKVQHEKKDFFRTTPLHRGVIADVLLKYFRPCEGEATFAEPTLSLLGATEEFVREASRSEVKDLSSVLSIHQDTVESSRSRTLLEASSELFEEQPSQLQPIEELQSPQLVSELQSPVPPPSPREGPAAATERRPSPTKKSKRPSATREPKKPSATKEPERGQEMSPTEQLEQQAVFSEERSEESSKDSTIMKEGLTKIILEALEHNPTMFLHDLLHEDAGEREATEVFSHLLTMYQKFLVDLHQETTYGPISVSLHSSDLEDQE